MGKFRRTPYGGDGNGDDTILGFTYLPRGNGDKLELDFTASDTITNRIHKGHYIPKFSEDMHKFGRGRGDTSNTNKRVYDKTGDLLLKRGVGYIAPSSNRASAYHQTAIAKDIASVRGKRG